MSRVSRGAILDNFSPAFGFRHSCIMYTRYIVSHCMCVLTYLGSLSGDDVYLLLALLLASLAAGMLCLENKGCVWTIITFFHILCSDR